MRFWIMGWLALLVSVGTAQTHLPDAVKASAVAAVEALGKRMVQGDHAVAIERMYPRWKARMAKRLGGEDEIEERLAQANQEMAKRGVSIISFKVVGEPTAYEVWPGKPREGSDEPVYDKWMLFIPTCMQFRTIAGDPPRAHVINSFSFQVAISDKSREDWSFINGSGLSVSDLRSLFASLPANLELPLVKQEAAN